MVGGQIGLDPLTTILCPWSSLQDFLHTRKQGKKYKNIMPKLYFWWWILYRLFLKDFVGIKRWYILYHPARLTSCNLPLNIFASFQIFLFLTKLPPFYLFLTFSPPNTLPSQPLHTLSVLLIPALQILYSFSR